MLSEVVTHFIDRQRWLDPVGHALQKVASAAFDHLGPLSQPIEDLLHGTPAGHPLHPALTDIPIGSWTATMALDLAGIDDGADLALNLGLAGALGAAVSGLADWRYTEGTQRRAGIAHALLNLTGTTLYAISSFQRRSRNRTGAKTLSSLGYLCILGGGYLGGDLAYTLGVMVNRNAWLTGTSPYTPVMPLIDLPDDQPTRASANGEDVVLVRRGERVYALAHSCAHLGGPMSRGKLEGDAIVCPWHGSAFALDDGHVTRGPAAYSQPCYATRIRDGLVEVQLGGEAGERKPWYRIRGDASHP
ncbi:MAG: Rieske (2Fe-2S) protein [Chloroflexota bacterium]|nr:Rieske (2Fe-2S) protein [Chloroflexota bacterium]